MSEQGGFTTAKTTLSSVLGFSLLQQVCTPHIESLRSAAFLGLKMQKCNLVEKPPAQQDAQRGLVRGRDPKIPRGNQFSESSWEERRKDTASHPRLFFHSLNFLPKA